MSVISIEQYLKEKQYRKEDEEYKAEAMREIAKIIPSYYLQEKEEMICQLCEGKHGDNTLCQQPWSA